MKIYKHLFFDLDRTLWDFDKNAFEAYKDIFLKHNLAEKGVSSLNDFTKSYLNHNAKLWSLYREGKIEKNNLRSLRFELTLLDFGIDDPGLAGQIGLDYITISPEKTNLFPNAIKTLDYLFGKYSLHLITNGFEEVQFRKLRICGLEKYFDKVITSEEAGSKKPDIRIFNYSLSKTGAKKEESIMIGDDPEVDIEGAKAAGIDQVFFNPDRIEHNGNATYEIFDLIELTRIFVTNQ